VSIAVSLYAGLLFALPVILSQLWSFLASGARPCGRAPDSPPCRLRPGARSGGPAFGYGVLLRGPCTGLTNYDTTHFQDPDPGEQLLLVRRLGAARRGLRLRDAAGGACARQPRRALVGRLRRNRRKATSSSRCWRLRSRSRSRDDAARAAADVAALEGSIWLAVYPRRRAAKMAVAGAQA
jgi:hypothetical protein